MAGQTIRTSTVYERIANVYRSELIICKKNLESLISQFPTDSSDWTRMATIRFGELCDTVMALLIEFGFKDTDLYLEVQQKKEELFK